MRRDSDVFGGRNSYATLRDLFRWADRYSKENITSDNHDWDRHLALDGYFLLGARCRSDKESSQVKSVIESVFRRKLGSDDEIFSLDRLQSDGIIAKTRSKRESDFSRFVWGAKAARMAILLNRALKFNEPALLVGPTGCGKTTIVQLLSEKKLHIINCHQQTEASDFIGGLRPIRAKDQIEGKEALFEWQDGPLVDCLKTGEVILVDEISLAEDSVLERLNSVLERERTLVVAEKGIEDAENRLSSVETLTANDGFQFIGTMNPGGDYGKKELSPALRNRMTEIWCVPPETKEMSYKKTSVSSLYSLQLNLP